MICRVLFILLRFPLFSVASGAIVALAATGQSVFYPIDSSQRGTEIVNTFNSLDSVSGTLAPAVWLQTTGSIPMYTPSLPYGSYKYVTNIGIVPYIQKVTETPHNTLLIVSYQSVSSAGVVEYIVLPPEQVVALLYFQLQTNLPTSLAPFVAPPVNRTVPYFSVDSRQRAADIVSAANQLMTTPFKRTTSQVWIQTTLMGPFLPQLNNNGLLKNVTNISVSNSLIVIDFLPPNYQGQTLTEVVSPEQVQWIIYVRDLNYPQN